MKNKALEEFQTIPTEVLLALATGQIDPLEIAKITLADRGMNKEGKWVGFKKSEEIWNEK